MMKTEFVATDENFKRSPHLFVHCFFIPSWQCT